MEAFLVLWVATLQPDRLDLLGSRASFILTPYLALTPVLVLVLGCRVATLRHRLDLPLRLLPQRG